MKKGQILTGSGIHQANTPVSYSQKTQRLLPRVFFDLPHFTFPTFFRKQITCHIPPQVGLGAVLEEKSRN